MAARPFYRGDDWDRWRIRFHDEHGGPYVVCEYGFGWAGPWLAGPYSTFKQADDVRRHHKGAAVTLAVLAIRPRDSHTIGATSQ